MRERLQHLKALRERGRHRKPVDFDAVVKVLETEGVDKFEASWKELLEGVDKSLKAASSGHDSPSDAA